SSIFLAVKLNEYVLVILPVLVAIIATLLKSPELLVGSVFAGRNLFGLILDVANFEQPVLMYIAIGAVATFSLLYLFIRGDAKLPERMNLIMFAFFLLFAVFFFNINRTAFPYYTTIKTVVFLTSSLLPFVLIVSIRHPEAFFRKTLVFAILLTVLPILYSYGVLVTTGILNSFGRFNPMELVHVNQFARGLGFITIISCWFFLQRQTSLSKFSQMIFMLSALVLILLSGSRGGFLATVFGVLTLLVVNRNIPKAKKILLILAITVIVILMLILGIGSVSSRMSNLRNIDLSVAGRVGMLRAAWEHKWDHILFGRGTGNFASILPAWAVGANLFHPHNVFVEYYIEWGLIGLAIFFLIYFAPFIAWVKIRKDKFLGPQLESYADLAFALIVFSGANGLTNSAITDPMFFLAIGLMASIHLQLQNGRTVCTSQ
ncbi:MAG: O-antigen ligase family protein, partial [bacterium]